MKKILIAEGVPLSNKGEEAIIRGIQDILFQDETIEIAVMDLCDEPCDKYGIHVFPYQWLYPYARPLRAQTYNLPPLRQKEKLAKYISQVLMLFGYLGPAGRLFHFNKVEMRSLVNYVNESDYIFLGHDGAWGIYSPSVLIAFKRLGKKVGILGCGTSEPSSVLQKLIAHFMYKRAIKHSDFCYCRDDISQTILKKYSGNLEKVKLAPDPAFGMQPAPQEEILPILNGLKGYNEAKKNKQMIICCTVCENSIVFLGAFSEQKSIEEKRRKHRSIIKLLIDFAVSKYNAYVIFLPHTIDIGRGNDVLIAHEIHEILNEPDKAVVLDADLSPRILKGIIRENDFLIGERTHSVIAAISTNTPFIALSNHRDQRTYSIVGKMCKGESLIFDLDSPAECMLQRFEFVLNSLKDIEKELEHTNILLNKELNNIKNTIINI